MCEIEYRNRTISSLVSELNSLGHTSTLLKPLTLLAVQREDHPAIRRFKNRDNHQFYLTDSSERKYYYD